jgi:hypothetical protein
VTDCFMYFGQIVCFLCNTCLKRCQDELVVLFFFGIFAVVCLCMVFYILYDRYKNELEKKDKEKLLRLLDHQKNYLVCYFCSIIS